jgi:hypothetical protein
MIHVLDSTAGSIIGSITQCASLPCHVARFPGVAESDTHRDLRHLLVGAAKAHHAVHPGPSDTWANWYAEHIYGGVIALTTSDPSLETLEAWLIEADARCSAQHLEGDWPDHYATWILEWDAAAT